ncbi:hypothetical protein Pcinc_022296 [Petrolisthes cinctipes]|uniref:Uncharacterized protein n=1 Tax=Petrolisthes cinctipes TaxID=88211 RepID=A0AAE1FEE1_PETCI|nr:hypothetical protein Pcinc_022296 [Petrolisthes cinctipes]
MPNIAVLYLGIITGRQEHCRGSSTFSSCQVPPKCQSEPTGRLSVAGCPLALSPRLAGLPGDTALDITAARPRQPGSRQEPLLRTYFSLVQCICFITHSSRMSERYSRPRTPPGPPPSRAIAHKSSTRGPAPAAAASSSKSLPTKSFESHSYNKYDTQNAKSSSSSSAYPSGKTYVDDKYKSSSSAGKLNEKVPKSSKYGEKSGSYDNDNLYKSHEVKYPDERYGERGTYSNHYPEKGRYAEKYLVGSGPYGDKYSGKKYDYDAYMEKASKYPRHEGVIYRGGGIGSVGRGPYDSYASYIAERPKPGSYSVGGIDKRGGGVGSLMGDFGGRGGAYTGYGDGYDGMYSTMGRGGGSGGSFGTGGGRPRGGLLPNPYPRDKKTPNYGDGKLLPPPRSRMYPGGDHRPYPDYGSSQAVRSLLSSGGVGYRPGEYDRYSPRTHSPEQPYHDSRHGAEVSSKQKPKHLETHDTEADVSLQRDHWLRSRSPWKKQKSWPANHDYEKTKPKLDRYVIGDSVVYGSPGHYPHDLNSTSPRHRPPSPPSPQPLLPSFSRYPPASPRGYSSTGRRSPSSQQTSSKYPSLSLSRRATSPSPRRPPSPPNRRPPSPKTSYARGQSRSGRSSREQADNRDRSKDRYSSKSTASRGGSPTRDRGVTNRSSDRSRGEQDKRKELVRRGGSSRERSQDMESSRRGRRGSGEHHTTTDYHNNSSTRSWGKDTNHHHSSSSGHQRDRQRGEERRLYHSPQGSSARGEMVRERRREDSRGDGEQRNCRRLEDRLGPSPSQTTRSSVSLHRLSRRPASPRDKRSRRPDDLRLWIESRKSEGGKSLLGSPSMRSRPGLKRVGARSSEQQSSLSRRTRLGDPKKRLGGYKGRRRALPVKRNKILKKYQRLTVKRGARSGGRKINKDSSGRGGGDDDSKATNDKPGSTATIRRVIKKPKNVSHVNRLALKPRVIRKPTQKLLKDPKEVETREENSKELSALAVKEETSESDDKGAGTSSDPNKRPA